MMCLYLAVTQLYPRQSICYDSCYVAAVVVTRVYYVIIVIMSNNAKGEDY